MSTNLSSLDRIADLKAQIAAIEQGAIRELVEKRNTLSRELVAVEAEIARLTGKPVDGVKSRASAPKAAGKSPSLQELKAIIAEDPEKTLNIRKGGYDLRNIKVLAQANPGLLQLGGKGVLIEALCFSRACWRVGVGVSVRKSRRCGSGITGENLHRERCL